MSPAERRDLLKQLAKATESATDHRLARVCEHLYRACEEIELATREDSTDDEATRRALLHSRVDFYREVRAVLAILEAQRARIVSSTVNSAPQTATVKP